MTSRVQRQQLVDWINAAIEAGARQRLACDEAGIHPQTYRSWRRGEGDRRPTASRPEPANKLCEQERRAILHTCNEAKYAQQPPSQIVPDLADQGIYLASESSFYRVLKQADQLHHRGRAKAPRKHRPPTTHVADGPNQLWSWDISYLPTRVRGLFYYLYLILDIYSRKIVGWEVHECEGGEQAASLIQRTVLAEGCFRQPLVLHADNGAPMKSQTLQAKLLDLGITTSHSRPRVSNDNPYSESLFRTLKYCPQWPVDGFASLADARAWVDTFVAGYNQTHRHSAIRFVTPEQRHRGEDKEILARREKVYEDARKERPERWSGQIRNWSPIGSVALNPERDGQPVSLAQ